MEIGSATRWLMGRGFELRLRLVQAIGGRVRSSPEPFVSRIGAPYWTAQLKHEKERIDLPWSKAVDCKTEQMALEALEACARQYFTEQRERYEEMAEDSRQQVGHFAALESQFKSRRKKA